MQLGKFRSSQLSMCKVQRVKGLQVGITWGDFREDAKRQHTAGTKNLISTKFQTLTIYWSKRRPWKYMWVYILPEEHLKKSWIVFTATSQEHSSWHGKTWKHGKFLLEWFSLGNRKLHDWREKWWTICLLSGFRCHPLRLLWFLVTPGSALSCSSCCWPSATRRGHFCHVLEAKNLNGDSTLPWKVIPSPFRWRIKSHSKSDFVRLYLGQLHFSPSAFSVHYPMLLHSSSSQAPVKYYLILTM